MPKNAKLSDLFRRGKEVVVTDAAAGLEGKVWLKKLNPIEAEDALRGANAARARVMISKRDTNSDFYQSIVGDVIDLSDEQLVDLMISGDASEKIQAIGDEVAAEEEWSKDGYLQGLRDSWRDGQMAVWIQYATDEEAQGNDDYELWVAADGQFKELQRFRDAVDKLVEGELTAMRRSHSHDKREEMEKKVIDILAEQRGNEVWLAEFNRQQVYFATTENKKSLSRYFGSVAEVRALEPKAYIPLVKAYRELEVENLEGKDSQETPAS